MTPNDEITTLLHRFQEGDEEAQAQLVKMVQHELRVIAARYMRRILVDHARKRIAGKRGGGFEMLPLDEGLAFSPQRSNELIRLDEAMTRPAEHDPRASRVIELRFFGGLSIEETAEVLHCSPRTVKREWTFARAWLREELGLPPETAN